MGANCGSVIRSFIWRRRSGVGNRQPETQLGGNKKYFMNRNCKEPVTQFAAWLKRKSRPALTLLTVLLGSGTMAHATVMDSIGNYLYGGFTGPLAKALAVVIFIISILGIKNGEGRAFQAACVGAFVSGGILAAPLLVGEFNTAVG